MSTARAIARLAWRESRAARRRLLLYMSAIAIGVAALVAIDSFARNVTRSVSEQARTLLGGDLRLAGRRPLPPRVDSLLDSLRRRGARTTASVSFPSMALVPRTGRTRLATVRGIGAGYPLYGRITTDPPAAYGDLQRGANALVDPALLIATDARVGDTLKLGYGKFRITGTLRDVPGTSGLAAALGPRVFIPWRYVAETQLVVFGSTAEYATHVALPPGSDATAIARRLRPRLDSAGVSLRTVDQAARAATNATESLADFISIAALTALLLGGIGVASGVRAFVARKIDTVAILRCLGASSGQVLAMYVAQAAAMGIVAAIAGAVLGVGAQFALPYTVTDLLPLDVHVMPEPAAIAAGIVAGSWIALVFALRPLLALRNVAPLQTLRRDTDADILRTRWRDPARLALDVALAASVALVAVTRARTPAQGLALATGAGGAVLLLVLVAQLLVSGARRALRSGWTFVVRQGVANVYRPGNQTRAVIVALGFGAFLLTTLYGVQANLARGLGTAAAASGANVVFFDVQEDQGRPLDSLVRARGFAVVERTPVIPMRISAVNGRSSAQLLADTGALRRAPWTLRREYRSTIRDTLTAGERIVAGRWFARGGSGARSDTGEVSLEQGLADELRVHTGDVITWDVQGVNVPTRVTSVRAVRWTRFEPNFFAVFPPAVLAGAPRQYVILARVPGATNVAVLQRDVVRRYPNVSSIDLSLVTETIDRIVGRVITAARFMALFSLLMGIPVLFSAVSATRRERIREGVLLKTLGATRRQVVRILAVEYALLGTMGAISGALLAVAAAWALMRFVFHVPYAVPVGATVLIAITMVAVTMLIGVVAGRDVFRETPMAALRDAA